MVGDGDIRSANNTNVPRAGFIMVRGISYINLKEDNEMIGIILLGQSNSGKSTIGKDVANKLDIRYISSGDIARSMNDVKVQESLMSGGLAPEDEMRNAVLSEINSSDVSYILDGFPRFYEQYEWLNEHVGHDLVYIYLDAPRRDILIRAKSRGRYDDGSIEAKMKFFSENTEPMIREIMNCGEDVHTINNGDGYVQDAMREFINIVEGYLC